SDDGLSDRKRQPIDYIAIRDLRHGLTADELGAEIRKLFPAAPFTTRWKDEDLVEMYCTDSAAKHENLPKWLSVLKKKLPYLGIAGLDPETPEAWDDESVPENWESLNLSDKDHAPESNNF
ncbi:hypothetical protein H4S02_005766, partial [Coemansia sp. RSA 2611]